MWAKEIRNLQTNMFAETKTDYENSLSQNIGAENHVKLFFKKA